MQKNLHINDLLDYYGSLLTPKQQLCLTLYYNDDLSLSEIAENIGGTRQGALELIKRAENRLMDMERQLGLHEKSLLQKQKLTDIQTALSAGQTQQAVALLAELEALI